MIFVNGSNRGLFKEYPLTHEILGPIPVHRFVLYKHIQRLALLHSDMFAYLLIQQQVLTLLERIRPALINLLESSDIY